jgi:hypothetical protein
MSAADVMQKLTVARPEDTVFISLPGEMTAAEAHDFTTDLGRELFKAHRDGKPTPHCVVMRGGGIAFAKGVADLMTRADMLAIYNGMKEDAPAILANVEPGDHGDAILEAFGRRVIEAAMLRMGELE